MPLLPARRYHRSQVEIMPPGTPPARVEYRDVYHEPPPKLTTQDYAWRTFWGGIGVLAVTAWLHMGNELKRDLANYEHENKKIDLEIARIKGPDGYDLEEMITIGLFAIGLVAVAGGGATVIIRKAAGG